MTLRAGMEAKLDACTLQADEIKAIMEIAIARAPAAVRWNDPADSYPASLSAALWVTVQATAERWLKEHAPGHIARVMLASDKDRAAMMAILEDGMDAIEASWAADRD